MPGKVVLVSDDSDFFEYLIPKLELRKSDELFTYSFDSIPDYLHLLQTCVLIINSENSQEKTLELLNLFKSTPLIIFTYNDDDIFRRKCYRAGAFDFLTVLIPDSEFRARLIPALSIADILEKNELYRKILEEKNVIQNNSEVFIDFNYILEKELKNINTHSKKAVFLAVSPNEKSKFLLTPQMIETTLLNNMRRNDILMNYAPNKYFLLMYDININSAQKIWQKIANQLPERIYAGFCNITNQNKQQLINEALNKLHEAINYNKTYNDNTFNVNNENYLSNITNFKMFRQKFGKKIERIVSPVFYQIQQKYSNKFTGVTLEQGSGDGYGTFYIKGKFSSGCFRITSPGFSKINIDITYQKNNSIVDAKRISLEPEELEAGLLEDLLEQFMTEYKVENDDEHNRE